MYNIALQTPALHHSSHFKTTQSYGNSSQKIRPSTIIASIRHGHDRRPDLLYSARHRFLDGHFRDTAFLLIQYVADFPDDSTSGKLSGPFAIPVWPTKCHRPRPGSTLTAGYHTHAGKYSEEIASPEVGLAPSICVFMTTYSPFIRQSSP